MSLVHATGAPSHRLVAALAAALAAATLWGCSCGTSHQRETDAGPFDTGPVGADSPSPGCTGSPPFFACVYCGGDVGVMPLCDGGAWVCPPGTMPPDRCPPTCWGPPPAGGCVCDFSGARPEWRCPAAPCGPGVAGQPCDVEGESCGTCCPAAGDPEPFGPFVCRGGRWTWDECEACPPPDRLPCPAARTLGARCANEGQLCGDSCCDTATICDGGVWTPGPVADCAACWSFACGAGNCRGDEACAMLGCPGEEQCLPLADGCTGCDCLELPPLATCEERDDRVFLVGGDCG